MKATMKAGMKTGTSRRWASGLVTDKDAERTEMRKPGGWGSGVLAEPEVLAGLLQSFPHRLILIYGQLERAVGAD